VSTAQRMYACNAARKAGSAGRGEKRRLAPGELEQRGPHHSLCSLTGPQRVLRPRIDSQTYYRGEVMPIRSSAAAA
jgi:hypothetical protein